MAAFHPSQLDQQVERDVGWTKSDHYPVQEQPLLASQFGLGLLLKGFLGLSAFDDFVTGTNNLEMMRDLALPQLFLHPDPTERKEPFPWNRIPHLQEAIRAFWDYQFPHCWNDRAGPKITWLHFCSSGNPQTPHLRTSPNKLVTAQAF